MIGTKLPYEYFGMLLELPRFHAKQHYFELTPGGQFSYFLSMKLFYIELLALQNQSTELVHLVAHLLTDYLGTNQIHGHHYQHFGYSIFYFASQKKNPIRCVCLHHMGDN